MLELSTEILLSRAKLKFCLTLFYTRLSRAKFAYQNIHLHNKHLFWGLFKVKSLRTLPLFDSKQITVFLSSAAWILPQTKERRAGDQWEDSRGSVMPRQPPQPITQGLSRHGCVSANQLLSSTTTPSCSPMKNQSARFPWPCCQLRQKIWRCLWGRNFSSMRLWKQGKY